MNDWYVLLIPVAVFSILMLVRFMGCAGLLGLDDVKYQTQPGPQALPDYPKTVLGEKDGGANPVLVSYWRLQEQNATSPAKDENGINNGAYKKQAISDRAQDLSPAAPGTLTFGRPGLLGFETSSSILVDGGSVEVPFSATLNLTSFTLEALVAPEWDAAISTQKKGRVRCVIEFGGIPPKKTGYGLYAGPDNPQNPNSGIYRWLAGLGSGTAFVLFQGPPVQFNVTNYVALTYDGASKQLTFFVHFGGNDMDKIKQVQGGQVVCVPNTTSVPFRIGMGRAILTNDQNPRHPLKGKIQEVAVYKVALREERIVSHIGAAFKDL
jgi:hypothetical protein